MSTRAISSQRNKRTSAATESSTRQQIPPAARKNIPTNATNTRRELSVQEAFGLINNKISNLEKAVFEGDFTRPSATTIPPKKDEIEDIYKQISELKKGLEEPPSNPYTSISTATTFDTINAELLMMKNDIMSTRNATQKVDHLNDELTSIKDSIASIGNSNNLNLTEKVTSIEKYVSELKDVIIKLQNFTLEINDMCLKHIRTNAFDPFDMLRTDIPCEDHDENENGIIIDHEVEEEPVESDVLQSEQIEDLSIEGVSIVITENETTEPETEEIVEQDTSILPPILPPQNSNDEIPQEPTPILEEPLEESTQEPLEESTQETVTIEA
jgi:hypothetical protein